ncbi:MAG: hypothetical protein JRJ39_14905 [Deltaproteobacteria bacterium]|nr:hypothetical protein [Deltaproteobacteria bacterium]
MNQKYLISKSMEENKLIIKEFVELEKNDDYSLTYEGTYDGKTIMSAISKGKNALVLALRTTSFYPTGVYVEKIAEACIDLCSSEKDASIELFFNDKESIKKDWKKPADKENIEDEQSGLDEIANTERDELDGLIGDDT